MEDGDGTKLRFAAMLSQWVAGMGSDAQLNYRGHISNKHFKAEAERAK